MSFKDKDVEVRVIKCGTADDPTGTGMPAWPEGPPKYYTLQTWLTSDTLEVQAWTFLEPGFWLKSLKRSVIADKITLTPEWEAPGPIAACYSKFGVITKFRNLPHLDYKVEVLLPPSDSQPAVR
jgi:hypothetical protein